MSCHFQDHLIEKGQDVEDMAETVNEVLGWYGYGKIECSPDPHLLEVLRRSNERIDTVGSREENGLQVPQCNSFCSESSRSPAIKEIPKQEEIAENECTWCKKPIPKVDEASGSTLDVLGLRFCSENCFSMSRRDTFKRAKYCDWCRHIRHNTSYMDIKDGENELNFCSEKCLTQYKMRLFVYETQAQIDLNPHLRAETKSESATGGSLITPEMWLRKCPSPQGSRCASQTPDALQLEQSATSPTPVTDISVTPTSKHLRKRTSAGRHPNKRKLCLSTVTSVRGQENTLSPANIEKQVTDRASRPGPFSLAPADILAQGQSPLQYRSLVPGMTPTNLIPTPHMQAPFSPHSHFLGRPPPPPLFNPTQIHQNNFTRFGLPSPLPLTVFVPYPVILPVPMPIPIPLPFVDFLHAAILQSRITSNTISNTGEEALDFTTKQSDRSSTARRFDQLDIESGPELDTDFKTLLEHRQEENNVQTSPKQCSDDVPPRLHADSIQVIEDRTSRIIGKPPRKRKHVAETYALT